jgi:hypothetical protein
MKKTYTTPTLVNIGDAVHHTRSGGTPEKEIGNPLAMNVTAGSIGYFL